MSLREKAMLVDFTLRCWTARKHDKVASQEIADAHADGNADAIGRYNKILIAKDAISEVQRIGRAAREAHKAQTLPWRNDGTRLIPTALYLTYCETQAQHRRQFEAAVARFIDNYPALIEEARQRLNGLFNEADYPSVDEIAESFEVSCEFFPIPESSDIRVDLADAELARLRDGVEDAVTKRLAEAQRDVWQRVHDTVGHIAKRMRDYSPRGGKLHKSVISNLAELCDVLPALNFSDDPNLEAMRRRLESKLTQFEVGALRDKASERKAARQEAESVLDAMAGYMGAE